MRDKNLREEMFSLCRQWEESGETRESFCRRHHINIGKFSYWRSQYLTEGKLEGGGFISLTPEIDSVMEIHYPNGVMLKVPGKASLPELKALITLF